jgi:hypothetical protein
VSLGNSICRARTEGGRRFPVAALLELTVAGQHEDPPATVLELGRQCCAYGHGASLSAVSAVPIWDGATRSCKGESPGTWRVEPCATALTALQLQMGDSGAFGDQEPAARIDGLDLRAYTARRAPLNTSLCIDMRYAVMRWPRQDTPRWPVRS